MQHDGSLYDATVTFVQTASECKSLAEFQKKYPIYDFGENHLSEEKNKYPHDNFVYNLTETGYKKMLEALNQYIENVKQNPKKR